MPAVGARTLTLVVPGPLDTPTGGYAYDRHVVAGLERRGWTVDVRVIEGGFPTPSAAGLAAAEACLAALDDGALVLADGLAFGAMPGSAADHGSRLRLVALVHHPLADETGLTEETQAALFAGEQTALAHVRGVIVTSRATARRLAAFAVPANRITVAEPGVDPAPPARGTRAGDGASPVRILCVATLSPRKGHLVLVDALARLRDLRWELECVGSLTLDAATAAQVQAHVRDLALDGRITFPGAADRTALDAAYDRADLVVQPSFHEGYGMAVAEAVARGLPVIGSRTGALDTLVDDGRSGLVVPPGDVDALTAALTALIGDDRCRRDLAAGAQARAATLPTWNDTAIAVETALLAAERHGELRR